MMTNCFRSIKSSQEQENQPISPPRTRTEPPEPLPKLAPEPPKPVLPDNKTMPKATPRRLFHKKQCQTLESQDATPVPGGTPTLSIFPASTASVEKVSKRSRPRKDIQAPSFDDFPVTGTTSEQKHWLKVKNTAYWHYSKLSGPEGEEYRKKESAWVQKYKCIEGQEDSNGVADPIG